MSDLAEYVALSERRSGGYTMDSYKNQGFHYSWKIVLGSFIMMALLHSMLQTCFSLFMTSVTKEMSISQTAFSGCISIVAIATMLRAPQMGKMMASGHRMKRLIVLCIVGMGLSYASYSLAGSIVHMYISAAFVGIFSCGATILPITLIITNWFYKRRDLALGIAFAGSGIGGSVISPLLTEFISLHGWRNSFVLFGILMIVIEVPVVMFIIYQNPEDRETVPYGLADNEKNSCLQKGLSLNELKKHPFFYIYLIGIFSICIAGYGSLGYLSASLTDSYSVELANAIIPFFLFILTPAKIFLGWVYDCVSVRMGTIYVTVTYTIAFLLLQIPNNEALMWIMAVFFAFGISAGTVIPSVITADLFGTQDYGALFGVVYAVCMCAMAVGNPLLAVIYDLTASYNLAWSACMTLCVLSGVCIVYTDIAYKQYLNGRGGSLTS